MKTMKKRCMVAAIALTLITAAANAADRPGQPEVIRTQTVTLGGVAISVPTTKLADGQICQSYIAYADMHKDAIALELAEYCDEAVSMLDNFGHAVLYPQGLRAMTLISHGEQGAHVLDLEPQIKLSWAAEDDGGHNVQFH